MAENKCVAWDEHYLDYIERGYSVIPLAPKQKGPKLSGWSIYCEKLMMADVGQQFVGHDHNIGLCLGTASGIMAVDVDTDDPALLKRIEAILPPSPVRKKGKKGFTAFYAYDGQTSQSVKDDKGNGMDILCHGRQTVLPPSVHPSGQGYIWLTKDTVCDIPKGKWPKLEERTIEQLRALFKVKPKPAPKALNMRTLYSTKEDEVWEALQYIDPDEDYNLWVNIGLAIRSEFGIEGASLFYRWSARGAKCDDMATNLRKYNSFESVRDISIATLFYEASVRGYEKKNDWSELQAIIGDEKEQQEAQQTWETILGKGEEPRYDHVLEKLLTPPGFLGEVYDWISKTSPVSQPMYAIASAIAFCSVIWAHKFKGDRDSRSNLYVIAVGPTGSGKNTVCDSVPMLLSYLPPNYANLLIGEPKSDSGLIDALTERGGKGIVCIDEIGHYLHMIKSSGANAYTQAVGAEFTKLFSKAKINYVSAAYSGRAKRVSVPIPEPCLVVFGQSVKDKIFCELKKDDFIDGFFNRWLIFESTEKIPAMNTDYVPADEYYPQKIVDFVTDLDRWIVPYQLENNFGKAVTGVNAVSVPITPEARQMLTEYGMDIDRRRGIVGDGLYDYPLSRAKEHCSKLALVAMEFVATGDDELRPAITPKSVQWAIAATEHHLQQIRDRIGDLTGSDYEAQVADMLKCLPINKPMGQSEFANYARQWTPKMRKEMLTDLLTRGSLGWKEMENGNKKLIRYK